MKPWTTLFTALVLTGILGCSTPVQLSENRQFPKRPRFKVKPEYEPTTARLDFDAVYYLAAKKTPGTTGVVGGDYFRFWPNGRVLITYTQSDGPPSAAEADVFGNAYLGYFRISGSQLTLEVYAPEPGKEQWSYCRVEAVIDANGDVIETGSKMGDHVRESHDVFVKRHLEGMKRMPDW